MSFRTTRSASNEETLRYQSLLRPRTIEVSWIGETEPVTQRNPASADRIAADVPVLLEDRAA